MFSITSVKLNRVPDDRSAPKLLAYAEILIDDCLAIHDIKVVRGVQRMHVSMPGRPMTDRCPKCRAKCPLINQYCGQCGEHLMEYHQAEGERIYRDIAHPITQECRAYVEETVLKCVEPLNNHPESAGVVVKGLEE